MTARTLTRKGEGARVGILIGKNARESRSKAPRIRFTSIVHS